MFSMVTVASSTRMPTASASPPSVMMFMVLPSIDRQMIEHRIASGIEIVIIIVRAPAAEEQQDHRAGQRGRDHRLAHHPRHSRLYEDRLVGDRLHLQRRRHAGLDGGQLFLYAVHDVQRRGTADLQHVHQHAAAAVHAHDVGFGRVAVDARCATSPIRITAPFTTLIGAWSSSSGFRGLEFSSTLYSISPIFSVPAGMIRFWSPMALRDVLALTDRRTAVSGDRC